MVLYQVTLELTPTEMIALGYALGVGRDAALKRGEEETARAIASLYQKIDEAGRQCETPRGD
jgi:hypothetical protein